MTEPKLKGTQVMYYEEQKVFSVEINGKVVKVEKHTKQDELFNDHEQEIEVIDEKKVLTEEERDEVYEFVEGLE